jgi:hypothetical protein
LAVGRYDLQIDAAGFQSLRRTGLMIDADAAVTVDVVLDMALSAPSRLQLIR